MTPTTKPIVRESSARDAGRFIIVIIGPGRIIGFRLKGTRKVYETTVDACYSMAVKAENARRKAERAAKRKGKR
jgi:hypothetical protein